ncbi:hypothetical protein ACF0H5_004650 [Mactra antiquata]
MNIRQFHIIGSVVVGCNNFLKIKIDWNYTVYIVKEYATHKLDNVNKEFGYREQANQSRNFTKDKISTIKQADIVTFDDNLELEDFENEAKDAGQISATPTTPEPIHYDGHNLMDDSPFKFDSRFKNPCWFEGDTLKCLPYMFLIGVKKCGTSDLFFRTSLHPDFVKPQFKEAQWFARKRFHGGAMDDIIEYVRMFDSVAETIQDNANTSSSEISNLRQVTGEGSPSNLHLNTHWRELPGNENLDEPKYVILDYIQHFLPHAKIMITFRDPVERLYSDYYHEYGSLMKKNHPNPSEFNEVVTNGVRLYKECFKHHSIRSCVFNPDLYKITKIQIQLGIYYIFWEELRRLFPREQILILQNKNLRDKETTMTKVYKFLELRELSSAEMYKVVNAKEKYTRRASFAAEGPMFPETLKLLQDFYGPFNKRMAELTNDNAFLYGYS